MSILCQLCGIPKVPSIRSYRDCTPLRQDGDQYLSNEPELTQHLKVCCSSKIFSIVSAVFSFLTVAKLLFFLHFSYQLWYVLHSIHKSPMYYTCKIIRKIPPLQLSSSQETRSLNIFRLCQSFQVQSVAELLFGYLKLSSSIVWLHLQCSQMFKVPFGKAPGFCLSSI